MARKPTQKKTSGKGKSVTPKSAKKAVAVLPKKNRKMVGELLPVKRSAGTLVPSNVDPLLAAYMREVQKYPLLSREEERELAIKFRETGDRDILQRLVTSNLRFVVKIAYEYIHYRVKLLDLIQDGNMGLVKAVQDFDPYKDVRLTTYAVWWIRSYIQDAILKNYSLVKMGTTQAQKKLFYRLRSEQAKLEKQGLIPQQNVKLLASKLDVREKDVEEMDQRLGYGDVSLNAPASTTNDSRRDQIHDLADHGEAIDDQLGRAEQRELFSKVLKEFLETLEGREKVIFTERLVSESPITLQEIGDRYGFTKERARQIEEQLKEKLREFVKTKFPDYELLAQRSSS